jgi:hypothetical protein
MLALFHTVCAHRESSSVWRASACWACSKHIAMAFVIRRTRFVLFLCVFTFCFNALQGQKLDILYSNIAHAFFQPAEQEALVILHFNLRYPILVSCLVFFAVFPAKCSFFALFVSGWQAQDDRCAVRTGDDGGNRICVYQEMN